METAVLRLGSGRSSSEDFATMLSALTRPGAFPSPALSNDVPVSIIQTHASAVLLTTDRVYKLKKPKNFGFFDYSTPALRRHFCSQEVRLNTRLAPQVYLGVAPVLMQTSDQFRFGPTFSPDDVPLPGVPLDGGSVVDYAVVMVRLPDEATLEFQVHAGTANPSQLAEIARYVGAFHAASYTDEHVASFGKLEVIRGNWEENFEQMRPYIGRTLDAATFDHIVGYIHSFLKERTSLFASRARDGRIRDCHGDLRLQHVYILNETDNPAHRIAILDGIEFNERFRYGDVASEVAFLTMELEAAGRYDLSRAFVDSYVTETGDIALRELLLFYACYRACVRGKVLSFQLDEPEVPAAQREAAQQEAASLFALAASYASGPTKPTLVMLGGLMGTGKSTLAQALQHELGWALFSSDTVRKQLAHLDPTQPQPDPFGQGLYSPARTSCTYYTLHTKAGTALSDGRSVLLDASFIRRADRQAAAYEAVAHGAKVVFIECVCPREIALQRLAQRWEARMEGERSDVRNSSDGRPDLYDAQSAVWEAFNADEGGRERMLSGTQWSQHSERSGGHSVAEWGSHMQHIVVTTTQSRPVSVEQILGVLQMPHSACWL